MSQSGYVHLEGCSVRHVTAAAILVEYEGEDYWLPRSQIADPDTYEVGDCGVTVSVTEWIANQKGIDA